MLPRLYQIFKFIPKIKFYLYQHFLLEYYVNIGFKIQILQLKINIQSFFIT